MAKKKQYDICPYCGKVVEHKSSFLVKNQNKSNAIHPKCFTRLIQRAKE